MLAPMTQFTMTAEALPAMPLIGVTGRVDRGGPSLPNVVGDALMEMFFTDFPSKIRAAGGQPILLSIHSDPRRIVEHLDALVLSGGSDVDPRRYGRTPGPNSSMIDPARDEFEFALVDAAWEIGLPILGVCRGHQVVNVARGGTLIADLPTYAGEAHSFFGYPRSYRPQQVALESGSIPYSLYGNSIHVNSLHHQAVDAPGNGLRIVGRALDRAAVSAAFEATVAEWGRFDYLVNNAGLITMSSLENLTDEEWDLVLDVNLKGMFIVTQIATPYFRDGNSGAVVNLSTVEADVVVSSQGFAQVHYNASKGGVKMLTKALAVELSRYNVRVNAIAPGPVPTAFLPGIDVSSGEVLDFMKSRLLVPRVGRPEDMGAAVSFLLSDDASYISGVQLPVDGGWLAR